MKIKVLFERMATQVMVEVYARREGALKDARQDKWSKTGVLFMTDAQFEAFCSEGSSLNFQELTPADMTERKVVEKPIKEPKVKIAGVGT